MTTRVWLQRLSFAAAITVAAVASEGCLVPSYVTGGIEVRMGPPAFRHEALVRAPGEGYLWVPGYWDWSGVEWAWVGGGWHLPPHPRARWTAPHYHQRHGHWYYVRGRWE